MDIDIQSQNKFERKVIEEGTAHIKHLTARVLELEGQLRQLRAVLKAVNRSTFDALGVGAELDKKEVQE